MGLLNDAGVWLAGKLEAVAGVTVTYTRFADGATIAPDIWVGRSGVGADPGQLRYHQWGHRDYVLTASTLTVSGSVVEPGIGDRIAETINGVAHIFEVQSDEAGDHWRWSDPARTMYRLHVKRVS